MFNRYKILGQLPNIELFLEELPKKIRGLYHKDNDGFIAIVLDRSLGVVERRCVLTEELAHHFLNHLSGFSCTNYSERLTYQKQENQALRWAANKLIPDNELKEYIGHNPEAEIWDLAEHFWVTEEIARFKISLAIQRGEIE